eukprot:8822421-Alexandrium_andersonii.AAC.1
MLPAPMLVLARALASAGRPRQGASQAMLSIGQPLGHNNEGMKPLQALAARAVSVLNTRHGRCPS